MLDPVAEWIERLLKELRAGLHRPNARYLDIEWLILRCEDTLGYEKGLREASVEQLIFEIERFANESPGFLSGELLQGPRQ